MHFEVLRTGHPVIVFFSNALSGSLLSPKSWIQTIQLFLTLCSFKVSVASVESPEDMGRIT